MQVWVGGDVCVGGEGVGVQCACVGGEECKHGVI